MLTLYLEDELTVANLALLQRLLREEVRIRMRENRFELVQNGTVLPRLTLRPAPWAASDLLAWLSLDARSQTVLTGRGLTNRDTSRCKYRTG